MREADVLKLQESLTRQEAELRKAVLKFAIDKVLVESRLRKHKEAIALEFSFFSNDIFKFNITGVAIATVNVKSTHGLAQRLDFNFIFPYMTEEQLKSFIKANYEDVIIQDDKKNGWRFEVIFQNYPEIDESVDSMPT